MPFIDDSIITIPSIPAIYTGTDEPNNPDIGMIWNEIDGGSDLLQQWNYLEVLNNYRWVSNIYHHSWETVTGATSTFFLVNADFDIFVRKYFLHVYSFSQTIVSGEFVNRRLSFGSHGGGNNELLADGIINNLAVNSHAYAEVSVDKLLLGTRLSGLNNPNMKNLINTNVISNKAFNTYSGISTLPTFTYQLVRK